MVSHFPVWVLPLLGLLVWLGVLQSRPRWVAPRRLAGVALGLGALSLWGVTVAFGPRPDAVLFWALGMTLALALGPVLGPRGSMSFDAHARRVHLPGSWLPLALMLGIFGIRFGLGVAAGLGDPVQGGSATAAVCALALGLLSGGFAVRARAVYRAARQAPAR